MTQKYSAKIRSKDEIRKAWLAILAMNDLKKIDVPTVLERHIDKNGKELSKNALVYHANAIMNKCDIDDLKFFCMKLDIAEDYLFLTGRPLIE